MGTSVHIQVGALLGQYRVLRQLGEGGMGAVFEGEHVSIARHVAIKVLHPEYAVRKDLVQRFFNEARAVNLIEHPGLVQISDYGQTEEGTAYIVMELLRGESLSKRLQHAGALPVADALRLARQIAATLAAVHQKGIVHRDLKPDNIMIIPDAEVPGGERCKLLDFGIAKLRASDQPDGAATKTSFVMGTPRYMAPEQWRSAKLVDDRSDVYSFGVMLFQMLAGRPPFEAEHQGDLLGMHMYQAPPSLAVLAPHVPSALTDLVTRMLAKQPGDRPGMQDVVAALDVSGQHRALGIGAIEGASPAGFSGASPLLPRTNSTLGLSTGEQGQEGLKRRRLVLGVLLMLSVSVATVSAGLLARNAKVKSPAPMTVVAPSLVSVSPTPTSSPSTRAAERQIVWQLRSNPSGAQVVRARDGERLGLTPLRHRQAAQAGSESLVLELSGYQSATLELDRDSNGQVELTLSKLAPVEKTAAPPGRGSAAVKKVSPSLLPGSGSSSAATAAFGTSSPSRGAPASATASPTAATPSSASTSGMPAVRKESHAPPPRREDFIEH